jgi:hypothetical protein
LYLDTPQLIVGLNTFLFSPCFTIRLSFSRTVGFPHEDSFVAYALPRDFIYFFDLRSPILDAFFFTASVGRRSLAAIEAVGLFGKSFLSRLTSAFVQSPFAFFDFLAFFFFAIFASFH